MTLRHVTNALLAALIAPPCAICARILDRPLDGAVCPACWDAINPAGISSFTVAPSVASAQAIGDYDGILREIIHAFKYDNRRSIAPRLARLMVTHGRDVLNGADAVVPVPLHRHRERSRGFNQADDLARGLGMPMARAVRRVRNTRSQVDLPAAERRANVWDAFAVRSPSPLQAMFGGHAFSPAGKVIVLIDDVTTTGATLDGCARVLQIAGAREVRALTAARVVTRPR